MAKVIAAEPGSGPVDGGGNPATPQGELPEPVVLQPEVMPPQAIRGGSGSKPKPPKSGQFKKGQSGNQAGRPRKLRHLDDFLAEIPPVQPGQEQPARPDGQPMDRFDAFMAILWRVAMDPTHRNWDDAAKYLLVYRLGKPRERIELGLPNLPPPPQEGEGAAPVVVVDGKTTGEMRKRLLQLEAVVAQRKKPLTNVG